MKARLLLFVMLLAVGLVTSCSDDDEAKIDPIVGEWQLDERTLKNPPQSYSNVEGLELTSLYGEEEYIIIFNSDFTYERNIENTPDFGDIEDNGTWEVDEDVLLLTFEDGDEGLFNNFSIVKPADERQFTIATTISWPALSDEIISSEDFQNDVETNDDYFRWMDSLGVMVDVSLELEFAKQ